VIPVVVISVAGQAVYFRIANNIKVASDVVVLSRVSKIVLRNFSREEGLN
jgi:hypothetical protein